MTVSKIANINSREQTTKSVARLLKEIYLLFEVSDVKSISFVKNRSRTPSMSGQIVVETSIEYEDEKCA